MKRIIAAILLMTISTSVFAQQSGKSIYNKYSNQQGVSAVYISPSMFRMIGKIPDLEMMGDEFNLAPVIRTLTGFYLIDSENKDINNSIQKDAEQLVGNGIYELLMEVKDDGETVRIYVVGRGDEITSFILIASGAGECTFICVDGRMSRGQLENLVAGALN